jgi:hypothetical protein
MSNPKPTDIPKQFAKLQKQAEKHVLKAKKAIEKKVAKEVAAVHKKYAAELKKLDGVLGGFTSRAKAPKAAKASGTGKRTRRSLPKRNDQEIKDAISKIAAGGKKVTSAQIFDAAEITRPRFNAFLKDNKGFLKVEGAKRSTVYFL